MLLFEEFQYIARIFRWFLLLSTLSLLCWRHERGSQIRLLTFLWRRQKRWCFVLGGGWWYINIEIFIFLLRSLHEIRHQALRSSFDCTACTWCVCVKDGVKDGVKDENVLSGVVFFLLLESFTRRNNFGTHSSISDARIVPVMYSSVI